MEANDGYTSCLIGSKISKHKLKCQRKKPATNLINKQQKSFQILVVKITCVFLCFCEFLTMFVANHINYNWQIKSKHNTFPLDKAGAILFCCK